MCMCMYLCMYTARTHVHSPQAPHSPHAPHSTQARAQPAYRARAHLEVVGEEARERGHECGQRWQQLEGHLHQVEGGHRAHGRGATSAHVGEARVSVGEVGEQHAPRAHLVAHLVRATIRG